MYLFIFVSTAEIPDSFLNTKHQIDTVLIYWLFRSIQGNINIMSANFCQKIRQKSGSDGILPGQHLDPDSFNLTQQSSHKRQDIDSSAL